MPTAKVFERIYILKLLRAPRFKKPYTIAQPPPWFRDPSKLSKAQVAQVIRFTQAAHATAGRRLSERMNIIKSQASGPTGYKVIKPKIPLPNLGKILTLADMYGIPVPPELRRVPAAPVAPAAPTAPARITE